MKWWKKDKEWEKRENKDILFFNIKEKLLMLNLVIISLILYIFIFVNMWIVR